ncbi:MAG TPA: U32 family peptidase, partial [Anaerolinea sp.]|nr:U32 family peptidase [Anaerolinea sp.]
MNQVELLSPARDLETGVAAINCGADAVYLGAARFGAREAAGNPLGDIEALAAYAHRYWAKVYVTVNTLLYDHELAEAERLVWQVYQAGADALIVQDMGLLELNLPPLPLFASTQAHNHTPERIAFLEKVGFQRAILARELTLEQIRAIRAQTGIELETFIHGALCVGYSGQCYLSYAIGGRSGHRGQCAQPCRRSYSLLGAHDEVVVRDRYLLSLRDLNLSAEIPALLDAGVRSFKIEGRLKDKAYVMNVVAHYRRLLDAELNRRELRPASSGAAHLDFQPDPLKTFNRAFTTYFVHGRGDRIASPETPKSLGEPLGSLLATGKTHFTLAPGAPGLHPGDGLCFLDDSGELRGTQVNRVEAERIYPAGMEGLSPGRLIFRNHDHLFLDQLEHSRMRRAISVDLVLTRTPDGLRLEAVDEDGNLASTTLSQTLEPAQQPEKMRETVRRQLARLGETEFSCAAPRVDPDLDVFVPVSALNALRREVIERLRAVRAANRPVSCIKITPNDTPYPQTTLGFEGNVLNHQAAAFYRRHG